MYTNAELQKRAYDAATRFEGSEPSGLLVALGNRVGELATTPPATLRAEVAELREALRSIETMSAGGVIERRETGKPTWYALTAICDTARATLARIEDERGDG